MRVAWICCSVLVACGSRPPPASHVANSVTTPAKPEPPSCASAARLLVKEHGFGKIPAAQQERARHAGELELEAACLADHWPDAALQCIATRPSPASCVGQLDEYQQERYTGRFEEWEAAFVAGDKHPGADAYGGDTYGGATYGGAAGHGAGQAKDDWVPCEGNYGDLAGYEPAIGAKAADREYALALRERAVHQACELSWTTGDKKCFGAAKDTGAIGACRGKLAEAAKNSLANLLADSAAKLVKVAALEKKPAAIDCKAVAGAHYGDDAWRGKLTGLAPGERKRVIDESRGKLAAACTAEKWQPSLRACLVSATGNERETEDCYPEKQRMQGYKWGFPAGGVMFKSGIAECDQLADLVVKIGACDKIEQELRDELLASFGSQLAMWLEMPASSRAELAKQCGETFKVYSEGAKDRGCTL